MKRIVIFSGAGMSAESGLKTFRDSGGLWEEYDIHEIATPEAWHANPALVLDFYNMRRMQVLEASPNAAHVAIAGLEDQFEVEVITQNIDDLHERAGSTKVTHLHGEILKARGELFTDKLYPVDRDIKLGDLCPQGSQLRPHVVWFGEAVPEFARAASIMETADVVMIVGTSLNVYPAAGLIHHAPASASCYIVDPVIDYQPPISNLRLIRSRASDGVQFVVDELLNELSRV